MNKTLRIFLAFLFVTTFVAGQTVQAAEWYKGQFHCHSHWSDGNVLPELAIDWYRSNGFHFMSLTDHNVLQLDSNKWREVDPVLIEESRKKFGNDFVETKEENGKTLMRLKTIHELRTLFNKDGEFLLIPGHEQNSTVAGRTLHAITSNISETIPFPNNFPTVVEAMLSWRKATLDNAAQNDNVGFWMVNHPMWYYWEVTPDMLIEASDIEFYEFNVDDYIAYQPIHPDHPTFEKSWDIINAFRFLQGKKPIYLVATDDTHDYRNFKDYVTNPGHASVVVRSEKLDANTLVSAMKNGDFYSSTGVELKDIRFDTETRTLHVEIRPEEDVFYAIRFIGTKKDFDTNIRIFEDPPIGSKPMRVGQAYSGDIGITFKSVVGISASYQMSPDDLYVRAVVSSTKMPKYRQYNKPPTESAWTQPYGWSFMQ